MIFCEIIVITQQMGAFIHSPACFVTWFPEKNIHSYRLSSSLLPVFSYWITSPICFPPPLRLNFGDLLPRKWSTFVSSFSPIFDANFRSIPTCRDSWSWPQKSKKKLPIWATSPFINYAHIRVFARPLWNPLIFAPSRHDRHFAPEEGDSWRIVLWN